MPTYSVSTWDGDDDGWTVRHEGLGKWDLRWAIREMLSMGYDTVSYLVEREEPGTRGRAAGVPEGGG